MIILFYLFYFFFIFSPRINVLGVEVRPEDFIFVILFTFFILTKSNSKINHIFSNIYFYFFILFICMSISTLVGVLFLNVNYFHAITFYLRDLQYFIIFFIFYERIKISDIDSYINYIIVLSLVVPFYSIYKISSFGISNFSYVASFPFDKPARMQVSGFCLIMFILNLCLLLYYRIKISYIISVFIYPITIILTASRSYTAMLPITLLLLFIDNTYRLFNSKNKYKGLSLNTGQFLSLLILLLFVIIGTIYLPETFLMTRLQGYTDETISNPRLESIQGARNNTMNEWINYSKESYYTIFFGHGKGCGPKSEITVSSTGRPLAELSIIRIYGEIGLFGLFIFLFINFIFINRINTYILSANETTPLSIFIFGILLVTSFLIVSFFQEPFYTTKTAIPYWMFLGILMKLITLECNIIHKK